MDLVKLKAFGDWSKLQLPTKEKREEILKYQLLIYAKVEDERERDQETSLKKREMKKKDVPWRLTGSCMHGVWLKWVREREKWKQIQNECLLLGFGISENNKYVWEEKDCVFLKLTLLQFLSFFIKKKKKGQYLWKKQMRKEI